MRFIDLSALGIQVVCVGINLVPGVLNLWRHKWGLAAINFGGAAFIIGINFFMYHIRKRTRRRMQEIDNQLREHLSGVPMGSVHYLAEKNLMRAVAALGAKRKGECVSMKVGRTRFTIKYRSVTRNGVKNTCYQHMYMQNLPWQESVASAMLILHRNPKIFDRWRSREGWHA